LRTCVGDRLVHDDHVLSGTDTVEFLPPVSGG
jgi:molybdopterin converting factor small subunit